MSTGGLSKTSLGRMLDVMAGYVERGAVPGLVTLVSRRCEVHVDAIGTKAASGVVPIRRDAIFRLSSMSQAVTAAATMILSEECRLWLDEPADRLLPELAGRAVLKRLSGPLGDTVPAQKAVSGLVPGYFDSHGGWFGVAVITGATTRRGRSGSTAGTGAWARPGTTTPGSNGHHPDDPGGLDVAEPAGRVSLFLGACLRGDRRLRRWMMVTG